MLFQIFTVVRGGGAVVCGIFAVVEARCSAGLSRWFAVVEARCSAGLSRWLTVVEARLSRWFAVVEARRVLAPRWCSFDGERAPRWW